MPFTRIEVIGALGTALAVSFLFWILVAYGTAKVLRFGICSVCGSVVTVWGANLFLNFLPGWITMLLLGQSVIGGATLFRDMIFARRIQGADVAQRRRYSALSQLAWFTFIQGGTFVLGIVGLVYALGDPLSWWDAILALTIVDAVLAAAFAFWVLVMFASYRLFRISFCQVCLTVSSVWVTNLVFPILPWWVTVFLMGQSVAGGAALGRDWASTHFGFNELREPRRRLAKQFTYFGLILAGTLASALILSHWVAQPGVGMG